MVIEEENKEDEDDDSAASNGRFGRGGQSHRNRRVDSDDDAGSMDRAESEDPASERSDVVRQPFDSQDFLFKKHKALDHLFNKVYEQLSCKPYSLQFFLALPK